MGIKNMCRILVGKPFGKWPLQRQEKRWEYNTKIHYKEICCGDVNCFEQA
jgi:hypothetical protein